MNQEISIKNKVSLFLILTTTILQIYFFNGPIIRLNNLKQGSSTFALVYTLLFLINVFFLFFFIKNLIVQKKYNYLVIFLFLLSMLYIMLVASKFYIISLIA